MTLAGPRVAPASGGSADALIVFLHGYGSNGDDLIALANPLSGLLPDAAFASPNAPERVPGLPMGFQWFDLTDRTAIVLAQGADRAQPVLDAYLDDELEKTGVSPERLVLFGFSQGCVMALQAGLRRKTAPAAILGYSGWLAGSDTLGEQITVKPPVLLVHGDQDDVVPFASLQASADVLKALDVPVTTHVSRGVAHGIAPDGLQAAANVLKSVL